MSEEVIIQSGNTQTLTEKDLAALQTLSALLLSELQGCKVAPKENFLKKNFCKKLLARK